MRVLVATAVPAERDAVARAFPGPPATHPLPGLVLHALGTATGLAGPAAPAPAVHVVAAGVGPAAAAAGTATALTAAALAARPYDLVISAGIGGGFAPGAPLGAIVVSDAIIGADLGAQTAEGFVPVTSLGFGTDTHEPPAALVRSFVRALSAEPAPALTEPAAPLTVLVGPALTVSTVTGTAAGAAALRSRHPRALSEGMEGFGVAEAAAAHGVPALEIRAVSNTVGPRDRAAWRVGEALTSLSTAFTALLPVLTA
ncbi:futalosine hydrolase [Streptomyces sp. NPDC007088]|uniref:futalosine hydrolase n=1 Tax=Streptomyces sp. NPDC007088 TaxID=3364773 RepID=UPI003680C719